MYVRVCLCFCDVFKFHNLILERQANLIINTPGQLLPIVPSILNNIPLHPIAIRPAVEFG